MRRDIERLFADSIAAKRAFVHWQAARLQEAIEVIANALENGHKLLLFGNGGSAADAQHLAAEFVNRFKQDRPPLPAVALTTDTSALTSIANDYSYEEVFAKQVRALGHPGDVAVAISTSGNARNVLRAVATCRSMGIRTIALTGGSGGKLGGRADLVLCVGHTTETARIQETHIVIGHVICELVDRILYGHAEPARLAKPKQRAQKRQPTAARRPLRRRSQR
jgi:D-sedoheptulose 7-phosphate isomerase